MKTKRKGSVLLTMGVLLLAAALALTAYNIWDAARAAREAQTALDEIHEQLPETPQRAYYDPNRKMPTVEIDGNLYIGTLTVPSLNLELPVMADWDYTKLKKAPCRYEGNYFANNLVVAGHNYAKHFSPIKRIALNADVYFTNTEGLVFHYVVDNVETLQPTQIDEMVEDGEWDLTLFTCTTGGQSRCTVRCVLAE